MKKNILVGIALSVTVGLPVMAAEDSESDSEIHQASDNVTINWQQPKDYTDVKAANESRSRFLARTLEQFDEIFADLGEQLTAGHSLDITVTDVDLAGQVWPQQFVGAGSGGGDVRLIKDIDIPRMEFSYELKHEGVMVKSADVDLKDMGFLTTSMRGSDSEPLRFEKRMLERWFSKEFSEQMAEQ